MEEKKLQVGVQSRDRKLIWEEGGVSSIRPGCSQSLAWPPQKSLQGRDLFLLCRAGLKASHLSLCFLPGEHLAKTPHCLFPITPYSNYSCNSPHPASTPVLSSEVASLVPGT